MTENEAVERLVEQKMLFTEHNSDGAYDEDIEVINMSINALEKVQQLKTIGTVEEFKDLKEQNIELHCEFQSINATMDLFEQEIRAKAIDEFLRKICEKYTEEESKGNYKQFCVNIKQEIADIAEQMKAGGKNE